MKNFIKLISIFIFSLPIAYSLVPIACFADTLQTAAQFMDVGFGARAKGMASAYTAVAQGMDAAFYNPAGLASQHRMTATAYAADQLGVQVNRFGFLMPLPESSIAFNAVMAGKSDLQKTILDGFGNPVYTGQNFSYQAMALQVSWAMPLTPFLDLGVNAKLLREQIADASGLGWGADVGIIYRPFYENYFRVGVMLENILQPEMNWNYQSVDRQLAARKTHVGIAYEPIPTLLTLASDIEIQESLPCMLRLGAEYWIIPKIEEFPVALAARGGIFSRLSASKVDTVVGDRGVGYSVGVGLQLFDLNLDYALMQDPYVELNQTQQMAVSYSF